MAQHLYRSSIAPAERTRLLWGISFGLALMVALVLASMLVPSVREALSRDSRLFPFTLVGLYLLFLLPSRRLSRARRFEGRSVSCNRRGLTWHEGTRDTYLPWRDVERCEIDTEVLRDGSVTWTSVRLRGGKVRLDVEQEAELCPLEGAGDLYQAVTRGVPRARHIHLGFGSGCPICGDSRLLASGTCPGCQADVVLRSPWSRPWRIVREEGVYITLLLVAAGPLYGLLGLAYALGTLLLPWVRSRSRAQVPLLQGRASAGADDGTSGPAKAAASSRGPRITAPVSAVVAGLVLSAGRLSGACAQGSGGSAVTQSPASSVPAAARVAPPGQGSAQPAQAATSPRTPARGGREEARAVASDFMPLAVGNTWEYLCGSSRLVQKVTAEEVVNGARCWVVESFLDGEAESTQRESFASFPQGLVVLKRTHRGSDIFLSPPELMLCQAVKAGQRWTWSGGLEQGQVSYTFTIEAPVMMAVAGRQMSAIPVLLTGRSADGSELESRRWYVKAVGMVRERARLRRGTKIFRFDAVLQNFALRSQASPAAQPSLP